MLCKFVEQATSLIFNNDVEHAKYMARALGALDWIVIAALVIIAAILIYVLQPLVIVIAIAAVAYLIYRWYTGRRMVRVS